MSEIFLMTSILVSCILVLYATHVTQSITLIGGHQKTPNMYNTGSASGGTKLRPRPHSNYRQISSALLITGT